MGGDTERLKSQSISERDGERERGGLISMQRSFAAMRQTLSPNT